MCEHTFDDNEVKRRLQTFRSIMGYSPAGNRKNFGRIVQILKKA